MYAYSGIMRAYTLQLTLVLFVSLSLDVFMCVHYK